MAKFFFFSSPKSGTSVAYKSAMTKNTSVFAIYSDSMQVEEAVDSLRLDGFRAADISVLLPEDSGSKALKHQKNSKAPEGAATGMGAGAMIGGALGWLVGIGALSIPDLGLLVAAGPIIGALAGAGAMGTVGGIAGALIGLSIPEYEARRYEGRLKEGGILMSVHCDDAEWLKRAKSILSLTGAQDIAAAPEARADYATSDRPRLRSHVSSRFAS
jgi:hypothetical protein